MLEDEAGPADPEGIFKSGARAGGNNTSTREGSFPLGLLKKGDEVANLVDVVLCRNSVLMVSSGKNHGLT